MAAKFIKITISSIKLFLRYRATNIQTYTLTSSQTPTFIILVGFIITEFISISYRYEILGSKCTGLPKYIYAFSFKTTVRDDAKMLLKFMLITIFGYSSIVSIF